VGNWGAFPLELKWPECEGYHSPPSSAKVKNAYISVLFMYGLFNSVANIALGGQ
jgi:hypothetical protein